MMRQTRTTTAPTLLLGKMLIDFILDVAGYLWNGIGEPLKPIFPLMK
jgi:hypothetical protein